MKRRKRFVFEVNNWDIGPQFGVYSRWETDLKVYLKSINVIMKALKFNTKLANKLLKMSKKEQEAYWEKYGL